MAQAEEVAAKIVAEDPDITEVDPKEEMVALIAYLQRLGIDIQGEPNKHADATMAETLTAEK